MLFLSCPIYFTCGTGSAVHSHTDLRLFQQSAPDPAHQRGFPAGGKLRAGPGEVELPKVWDILQERDRELEEQQQKLQSAHGQVSQRSSEVQRLEKQLADKEQELEKKYEAFTSFYRVHVVKE
ncbi:hypothetical protein GN956_G3289 [Arapaima gigas]